MENKAKEMPYPEEQLKEMAYKDDGSMVEYPITLLGEGPGMLTSALIDIKTGKIEYSVDTLERYPWLVKHQEEMNSKAIPLIERVKDMSFEDVIKFSSSLSLTDEEKANLIDHNYIKCGGPFETYIEPLELECDNFGIVKKRRGKLDGIFSEETANDIETNPEKYKGYIL